MPAETHLSIIAMILGGVFDQVPESLRICFAHGGGSFAFWLGRFENAWHGRGDVIATSRSPPRRTSTASASTRSSSSRAHCARWSTRSGPTQVMVGSDYPYPLGERPAADVVHRSSFLDEEQRRLILSGNARTFLGI